MPAREIVRLLDERPDAIGLSVPAMPRGSPGMGGPAYGGIEDPYRCAAGRTRRHRERVRVLSMTTPTIGLLVFDGCPLAEAARRSLEQALAEIDPGGYEEIDLMAPETDDALRGRGSPTILIWRRSSIPACAAACGPSAARGRLFQ